jgi:ABC-2 type transport system permease protein
VRTKAFIIGMAVMPILMFGGMFGVMLMEKRVDITDKVIAIIDHSGRIAPAIVQAAKLRNETALIDPGTHKQTQPRYIIELVAPAGADDQAQRLQLSDRVRARSLHAFVEIGRDVVAPGKNAQAAQIAYYAENSALDDVRGWIAGPINDRIHALRLSDAGVDAGKVQRLLTWTPVDGMGLVEVAKGTGEVKQAERSSEAAAFGVPYVMLMMLFIMIMVGASPLINSVLEEKMQRISEVLLGSARPFEIMMGKLIGNMGVSLTAALVYLAGGLIAAQHMGWWRYVPFSILPWFFVYLISGVLMFGAVYIAVGAACNDAKEAQSLAFPVIMPLMIPMFLMMPVIKEPAGSLALTMSLIPPFTPMLMLVRQSTPVGVPIWQPWVGLVGVIAFTTLCVWVGGRIFRVGLLMQGQPPTIRNLVRWAVRG